MTKKKQNATDDESLTWDTDGGTAETPAKAARKARLQPAELIPTATIASNGGTFTIRLRTGRQGETLDPVEAEERAAMLSAAADAIRTVARKVATVNALDDEPA